MNSIFLIRPYKMGKTWVFDEPAMGIREEAFVGGMTEILDVMTKDIPDAEKGFDLTFSSSPFPGAEKFNKIGEDERLGNGTWYHWEKEKMSGWLCSVLNMFFPESPENLYGMAK